MSTLTKICIVLVFVLALISCVAFYQTVSTTANYKKAYESQRQRADLANTEASSQMLAVRVWQDLYMAEKGKLGTLEQGHQNVVDTLRGEVRRLTLHNAELVGRLNELTAQLGDIDGSLKVAVAQNKALSGQLATLRDEKIKLQDELRRASDKIKEDEITIVTLTRARAVLQERVSELEQEVSDRDKKIAELVAQLASGAGAAATTVAQPPVTVKDKIEATVTAVKQDLASLNVGSASGVKKDMVFIIYRGAEFVGHLRVADVGTTTCAGIVYEAVKDVRVNDKATNKLD